MCGSVHKLVISLKFCGNYFMWNESFQDVAVVGTGRSHHKRKSKEILHNEPQCGVTKHRQFAKRIIGGKKAKFAELPWQVRCSKNLGKQAKLTLKCHKNNGHHTINTKSSCFRFKKGNFYGEKLYSLITLVKRPVKSRLVCFCCDCDTISEQQSAFRPWRYRFLVLPDRKNKGK